MAKLISILCALLLCIAISSAAVSSLDCSLQQKVMSSWNQDGMMVTQYSVTINNHSNKVIKSIHIATDRTLNLRDPTAIWNIQKLSNGDLVLPVGQPTIASKSSHTFYFILKGTKSANLYLKSVSY